MDRENENGIEPENREASGNAVRFLTVDEFRRGFFSERARPTRDRVRTWIQKGTKDGVRLDGILLDGVLLIDAERVDAFFARLYAANEGTPRRPSRRSPAARSADALAVLRQNYGF